MRSLALPVLGGQQSNYPLQPPAGVRCGAVSSGHAPAAAERER
jgi:hypothetical protein